MLKTEASTMRLTMNLGVKETFIQKVNAWSLIVAYFISLIIMQNPVTEEGGDSILYLSEIFGLYEMSLCVQRHLTDIKEVIKVIRENRGNLRHTPEELTVKPLRLAD